MSAIEALEKHIAWLEQSEPIPPHPMSKEEYDKIRERHSKTDGHRTARSTSLARARQLSERLASDPPEDGGSAAVTEHLRWLEDRWQGTQAEAVDVPAELVVGFTEKARLYEHAADNLRELLSG